MIGDGVCDEVTNNERCLFDGGDCCKEDKSMTTCLGKDNTYQEPAMF